MTLHTTLRILGEGDYCGFLAGPVRAQEEVPQGAAEKVGDPALGEVIGPVMDQVAALTEASEVPEPVVGWIVVKMRSG
jgi:hypothetical protein